MIGTRCPSCNTNSLAIALDGAQWRQRAAEAEARLTTLIADVRNQANVLADALTATPIPPDGITRTHAIRIVEHLCDIAERASKERT